MSIHLLGFIFGRLRTEREFHVEFLFEFGDRFERLLVGDRGEFLGIGTGFCARIGFVVGGAGEACLVRVDKRVPFREKMGLFTLAVLDVRGGSAPARCSRGDLGCLLYTSDAADE